jgi:hypothetical protein
VVDLEVEGSRIESTNGYAMSTWNMRIYTGLFRPLKSKTLRIVFGDCIASGCNSGRSTWVCPRGGCPKPPYIGRRPWDTSRFPFILVGYNMESLSELF